MSPPLIVDAADLKIGLPCCLHTIVNCIRGGEISFPVVSSIAIPHMRTTLTNFNPLFINPRRACAASLHEYPQETYNEYINAANQIISATPPSSPLLLVGDLNCHMGKLGGPRSSTDPNQRGVQWMDRVENHSLYVPSLSTLATSPVHTFYSSRPSATIDYAIGYLALSTVLVSCRVEEDHPLKQKVRSYSNRRY